MPDLFNSIIELDQPAPKKSSDYLKAYRSWVYSAVKHIAQTESSIEIKLYRKEIVAHDGKEDIEINEVTEHPSLSLLHFVNERETWQGLRESHSIYLQLLGEAAWALIRNGSGEIIMIILLRPDWLSIKPDKKGGIAHYEYYPGGFHVKGVKLDPKDVLFDKDFDPLNPYRGYGKVKATAMEIDIDDFQNEWNRNTYFNHAQPSMIVSTSDKLKPEQKRRFIEGWRKNFGGRRNVNKVAFLDGGKVQVDVLTQTLKEMDWIESKKQLRDKILATFHLSKSDIGIFEDVNRASSLAAEKRFMKNVIKPRLTHFIGFLNEFYLPNWEDENLFFNFENPVPEDVESKLKIYETGLNPNSGWLTKNEVREKENLPPVEGGDVIYQPFSLQPIGGVIEEVKGKIRGMFGKKKEKQDGLLTMPVKISKKFKKEKIRREAIEKLGAPIPPKSIDQIKLENFKKKVQPDLIKLVNYIMESADNKMDKMFTEEAKEVFWKQIVAKTDIQERLLAKILGELAQVQKDEIIRRIESARKNYKNIRKTIKASRFLPSKNRELKRWKDRIRPFLSKLGGEELRELLLNFGIRRKDNKTIDSDVNRYLRDEGLLFIDRHMDTMYDELGELLGSGQDTDLLMEGVNDIYDKKSSENQGKAFMIARIAIFGLVNWSILESFKQSNVVAAKEWVAAMDERTRESHAATHGQVVPLDEEFTLGSGNRAMRPLDPSLPTEDSIGCRCVMTPVIAKDATVETKKGGKVNVGKAYEEVIEKINEEKTKDEVSGLEKRKGDLVKDIEYLGKEKEKIRQERKKAKEDIKEAKRISGLRDKQKHESIIDKGKKFIKKSYQETFRLTNKDYKRKMGELKKREKELESREIDLKSRIEDVEETKRISILRDKQGYENIIKKGKKFIKEKYQEASGLTNKDYKRKMEELKRKGKELKSREIDLKSKTEDVEETKRISILRDKQEHEGIIKKGKESVREDYKEASRLVDKGYRQKIKELKKKEKELKLKEINLKGRDEDVREVERISDLRGEQKRKSIIKKGSKSIKETSRLIDKSHGEKMEKLKKRNKELESREADLRSKVKDVREMERISDLRREQKHRGVIEEEKKSTEKSYKEASRLIDEDYKRKAGKLKKKGKELKSKEADLRGKVKDIREVKRISDLREEQKRKSLIEERKRSVKESYKEASRLIGRDYKRKMKEIKKKKKEFKSEEVKLKEKTKDIKEMERISTLRGKQKYEDIIAKGDKSVEKSYKEASRLMDKSYERKMGELKKKEEKLDLREIDLKNKVKNTKEAKRIEDIRRKQESIRKEQDAMRKVNEDYDKRRELIDKDYKEKSKKIKNKERELKTRETGLRDRESAIKETKRIIKVRRKQYKSVVLKKARKKAKEEVNELKRIAKHNASKILKNAKEESKKTKERAEKLLDKAQNDYIDVVNKGKVKVKEMKKDVVKELKSMRKKVKDAIKKEK